MSDLSSKFTREEIQILIDAVNDWEQLGMGEWRMAQAFRDAPMLPDDHEAHELMKAAKEHFRSREMIINDNREVRMEQAVFLKAKLFLVRKNLNIDSLFEMPVDISSPPPVPKVSKGSHKATPEILEKIQQQSDQMEELGVTSSRDVPKVIELKDKLELAEFFIKDLGVWGHYEKFLAEKTSNS